VQVFIYGDPNFPIERTVYDERVRLIRSDKCYPTFEEHFSWALRTIDSQFLRTLRDDD
jgi:hypothetical protein